MNIAARFPRIVNWFDSLFSHIFLLQFVVGVMLSIVVLTLLIDEQVQISVHAMAPLWMQVLKPVQQRLQENKLPILPATLAATTQMTLIPGPPPSNASVMLLVPRYRALLAELQNQGLPIRQLAVSGTTGNAITWLEFHINGQNPVWVGLRGDLEGTDIRSRGTLSVLIAMLVFVISAAWLSRRVVKPLLDLQASLKVFAVTGDLPDVSAVRGPLEIRQLVAQFAEFSAQRAQLDEARGMMLAAISHDLRSPLSRIRIAAELLPDLPEIASKRDSIVRNTQLADKLVGSFLDLARAVAEPMEERVDLHALIRNILSSSDHAEVQLSVQTDSALWLTAASSVSLERLLGNLLDNATKYGKPPVLVTLGTLEGYAILTVRDHGPGIESSQIQTLRKPFFRGTQDRGMPGTGLGLAIVEHTVQRLSGEMFLYSANPGLAVHIRLPMEQGTVDDI